MAELETQQTHKRKEIVLHAEEERFREHRHLSEQIQTKNRKRVRRREKGGQSKTRAKRAGKERSRDAGENSTVMRFDLSARPPFPREQENFARS